MASEELVKHHVSEFDVIFLCYDEPNREALWADLQRHCPWAKKVEGVKGFDAAHKACANLAETDRFFTVDGDTKVDPTFWDLTLEYPAELADCQFDWASVNHINGLTYGNGSVKLWTKDFVLGMRTHENAPEGEQAVEFCWDRRYRPVPGVYSTTYPNATPFQAFRAGYREGVKMTLDQGKLVPGVRLKDRLARDNYVRLLIWASVGADVENGLWAIYGARRGIYEVLTGTIRSESISDFDWFNREWTCNGGWHTSYLENKLVAIGLELRKQFGLEVAELDADQSRFFKETHQHVERVTGSARQVRVY